METHEYCIGNTSGLWHPHTDKATFPQKWYVPFTLKYQSTKVQLGLQLYAIRIEVNTTARPAKHKSDIWATEGSPNKFTLMVFWAVLAAIG